MACKYQYNNQWFTKEELVNKMSSENKNFQTLYNNLVNEITNTETGRKILDRIKKDYVYKVPVNKYKLENKDYDGIEIKPDYLSKTFNSKEEAYNYVIKYAPADQYNVFAKLVEQIPQKYTLEEQQEEALVELVSEMVANKIKNTKENKNLIQLLKQLLKEISGYMRSLFNKKELDISKDLDNIDYLTNQKLNELMKKGLIDKNCN
jgi:hypothetical protein